MPNFRKKLGHPSCPKCGDNDWSISKDKVEDQSFLEYITEKAAKEDENVEKYMEFVLAQEVIFVFCYSCGYTVTAKLAE